MMQRRAAVVMVLLVASCGGRVALREAGTSMYTRRDTDRTTVASPAIRARVALGESWDVDARYGADVWTGASIDVRTSATVDVHDADPTTRTVHSIHERRHEVQTGLRYTGTDIEASARYRYSTEPDYRSHSGSLHAAVDLASKNTRLTVDVVGGGDQVGRAGDPGFREHLYRLGGRLSLSQLLDDKTILDLSYDVLWLRGFQSSPYRFVAIGGDGICADGAPYCLPENVPRQRVRHAPSLHLRRALSSWASAGLHYRFYHDTWALLSNTIDVDLAFVPTSHTTLGIEYRYYTQGEASFYRPRYGNFDETGGFFTRDRKLSALNTHSLSLSWLQDIERDHGTVVLGLRLTGTRFHYLAFVGLESVYALDMTAVVSLRLP